MLIENLIKNIIGGNNSQKYKMFIINKFLDLPPDLIIENVYLDNQLMSLYIDYYGTCIEDYIINEQDCLYDNFSD